MNKKLTYVVAGLLVAVPVALFAWGGECYGGWFGGPHMGQFYGGGLFMWITTILVIALLAFFGVRYFQKKNFDPAGKESPLDIAKSRYARGEITKEQFEALKKDLANAGG
jgi:putative membrane protein